MSTLSSTDTFYIIVKRLAEQTGHQYSIDEIMLFLNRYIRSGYDMNNYNVEQLIHDANDYLKWYDILSTQFKRESINHLMIFAALTTVTSSATSSQKCADLLADIFNHMYHNSIIISRPINSHNNYILDRIYRTIFYNISVPKTVQMLDALFKRYYPRVVSMGINFYWTVSGENVSVEKISEAFYVEHKIEEGGCDIDVDYMVSKINNRPEIIYTILLAFKLIIHNMGISISLYGEEPTGSVNYLSLLKGNTFNNIISDVDLDVVKRRLKIEN